LNPADAIQPPTGRFILQVRRNGILVPELCVDDPNLIVNGSKGIHAALLGGNVSNQSVTKIAYGTNGTAAAGADTAITGAFVKAIDAVTYPTSTSVQFAFSLGSAEDNGMAIQEFGLLTQGNTLYARKVRTSGALNKDADLSFSGTWTINF
jgi:hypothetical protein